MSLIVPPIKCQGIKTKLVPFIQQSVQLPTNGVWIEPFCGSGVVALNLKPAHALLCDTNEHLINLYRSVQSQAIKPITVRSFLQEKGKKLAANADHYYLVRNRFNQSKDPLDFLFLNRACFNGLMRFNRRGEFNVPFCRKPQRFSPAYITKIVNQVQAFYHVVSSHDWTFEVADFRKTLATVTPNDFVYADPPYAGRHIDYFNSWQATDQIDLIHLLKSAPCKFALSTWHSNQYRTNLSLAECWNSSNFSIKTIEHFYHVGATEDLRGAMTEALVANYLFAPTLIATPSYEQLTLV